MWEDWVLRALVLFSVVVTSVGVIQRLVFGWQCCVSLSRGWLGLAWLFRLPRSCIGFRQLQSWPFLFFQWRSRGFCLLIAWFREWGSWIWSLSGMLKWRLLV
ncbi:hypothetical protein M758_11G059400 [Ceratodon purpureus]|uniref:Uncharacterized protein n=1 Tax=Ceratodon purpureus TaxID=3225 RepID=A0A8T0GBJ3_CERPU|nr:hypothetical protein KC19_11G061300 [Ceratodon purpureus]KAG0600770.1 hypothetical protein M758_11G059400 [Ceratodon purpureus]